MVTYVKLPRLTWIMEEGLVASWLKEEGDNVEKGEPICEVESEKTIDEIEAPSPGILHRIVPAGSVVNVNQIIAIIAKPDEEMPDLDQIVESRRRVIEKPKVKPEAKIIERERVKISPFARKLAEKHKIDITKIEGTGPGGRIVERDILMVIEEAKVAPILARIKITKEIPLEGMRKVIAKRLSHSARTAVHVPITMEVDMTEMEKVREKLLPEIEEKSRVRISYTDILVKAVAKALEEYPIVNSIFDEDKIKIFEDINVGVAVATEEGLIVPVIRNANKESLIDIALKVRELVEKAGRGALATRETGGGTFTISNLGMFGVDFFAPIINPPESAILGVGRIVKKPVVINDQIIVRPTITLTLVFDHRVMDGAQAAQFLQRVKQVLEDPHLLDISSEKEHRI